MTTYKLFPLTTEGEKTYFYETDENGKYIPQLGGHRRVTRGLCIERDELAQERAEDPA